MWVRGCKPQRTPTDLESLVTKEMDGVIVTLRDVPKAKCFVPALFGGQALVGVSSNLQLCNP